MISSTVPPPGPSEDFSSFMTPKLHDPDERAGKGFLPASPHIGGLVTRTPTAPIDLGQLDEVGQIGVGLVAVWFVAGAIRCPSITAE